jgi:hypothetical protein
VRFKKSPELDRWIVEHTLNPGAQKRRGRKPASAYKQIPCWQLDHEVLVSEMEILAGKIRRRWNRGILSGSQKKRLISALVPLVSLYDNKGSARLD